MDNPCTITLMHQRTFTLMHARTHASMNAKGLSGFALPAHQSVPYGIRRAAQASPHASCGDARRPSKSEIEDTSCRSTMMLPALTPIARTLSWVIPAARLFVIGCARGGEMWSAQKLVRIHTGSLPNLTSHHSRSWESLGEMRVRCGRVCVCGKWWPSYRAYRTQQNTGTHPNLMSTTTRDTKPNRSGCDSRSPVA